VNDTYGHAEGDRYITLVSDHIREVIRKSDTPIRLGGDEFLIILPDCDMEEAITVLNRLTERLEEVNQSGQFGFTASISYGFAEYDPQYPPEYEALIALADNEMYKHKLLHKQERKA
jgi:diguanylate cyclase (GGDEF)-like protein